MEGERRFAKPGTKKLVNKITSPKKGLYTPVIGYAVSLCCSTVPHCSRRALAALRVGNRGPYAPFAAKQEQQHSPLKTTSAAPEAPPTLSPKPSHTRRNRQS